jgi:hypothetical protein
MNWTMQKRLFALALDRIGNREPINAMLEITLDERRAPTSSAMIFRREVKVCTWRRA